MKLESYFLRKIKDYSRYPCSNLFLYSMEGEEWKDIPQFDGYYRVSNYGRVWALPRAVDSITGQHYYTKERIRKQNLTKVYNNYLKEYTEHLTLNLRYEEIDYSLRVNRLVYEFFVGPLDADEDRLLVVHKDGDNCNNRFDNLVLMNGAELFAHRVYLKRAARAKRIIRRAASLLWGNGSRAIVQYTLAGEQLNEYESVAQAALANMVTRTSIREVAQQKLIQLHGLIYRFKGTEYHGEHAGFSYEKKVTQYAADGEKTRVFPSVKDAGLAMGVDPNTISRCALHKLKTCCGFVWRYDGDMYQGEYKDQIKNKPKALVQYNLDGTRVAHYATVNEAARITGYTSSTLLDSAHKRTKVAHGFVWRFNDEPYNGEYKEFRKGKPVTQYSREGNKIATYPTIEAAAKATGLTPDNIQKNVNGHNKTAGGFVWKFASSEEIEKIPFTPLKFKALITGKEVIQYSVEGKKLGVFTSIAAAAKACNVQAGGISAVLNIPGRTAAGFIWRTEGNSYEGEIASTPAANKARTVTQYNMDGVKLNVFKSTRQARQITGADSSVSFAARGKLKSTGGFIWRYGDGPERIDVEEHYASSRAYVKSISKPVLKYSLAGEFIKEYPSIAAAAKEKGIRMQAISSVINGQRKSAGGDFWKLKTDDRDLK
jgi:hypothetical protein